MSLCLKCLRICQRYRVLYEIGVEKRDGDVRYQTGSRYMAVLRMRNGKFALLWTRISSVVL